MRTASGLSAVHDMESGITSPARSVSERSALLANTHDAAERAEGQDTYRAHGALNDWMPPTVILTVTRLLKATRTRCGRG